MEAKNSSSMSSDSKQFVGSLHWALLSPTSVMATFLFGISALLGSCGFIPYQEFPNHQEFPFGIHGESDVIAKYGKPKTKSVYTVNSEVIRQDCYVGKDTIPFGRTSRLCYLFWKEQLVGYQYVSSADPDARELSLGKVQKLEKGTSTKKEVIAALGNPSGVFSYPLVADEKGTGFYYVPSKFFFSEGGNTVEAVISFDKAGIVSDISVSGRLPE